MASLAPGRALQGARTDEQCIRHIIAADRTEWNILGVREGADWKSSVIVFGHLELLSLYVDRIKRGVRDPLIADSTFGMTQSNHKVFGVGYIDDYGEEVPLGLVIADNIQYATIEFGLRTVFDYCAVLNGGPIRAGPVLLDCDLAQEKAFRAVLAASPILNCTVHGEAGLG